MGPLFAEFFGDQRFGQLAVRAGHHLLGGPEAVFIDLPLVPDVDASLLQPADVVRLRLIDPQHLQHGLPDEELLGGKNGKSFSQIKRKRPCGHLYGVDARAVMHPHALLQNGSAKR